LDWRSKSRSCRRGELAVAFADKQQYFVSEASVYRLLKAHDPITSPALILMKAADHFAQTTTAPNQLWQTDFPYLGLIGWGWFYLSTVLDDFSRYILAWKLAPPWRQAMLLTRCAWRLMRAGWSGWESSIDQVGTAPRRVRQLLQHPTLPRNLHNLTLADVYRRRGQSILKREGYHQTKIYRLKTAAAPSRDSLNFNPDGPAIRCHLFMHAISGEPCGIAPAHRRASSASSPW
jgi:hypothetical protein